MQNICKSNIYFVLYILYFMYLYNKFHIQLSVCLSSGSPGPQFSPRQVHVSLWWTKGHWDKSVTGFFWFPLSASLYQCSTLIHSSINDAILSQKFKWFNNPPQGKKHIRLLLGHSPLTIHNNRFVAGSCPVPGPEQRPDSWCVLGGGGTVKGLSYEDGRSLPLIVEVENVWRYLHTSAHFHSTVNYELRRSCKSF
jgi:hypothetical protein